MFFTPAIVEVTEAYRWRNSVQGTFSELYPGGMTEAMVRNLLAFDAGYQAGKLESYEQAKRDAKKRAAEQAGH